MATIVCLLFAQLVTQFASTIRVVRRLSRLMVHRVRRLVQNGHLTGPVQQQAVVFGESLLIPTVNNYSVSQARTPTSCSRHRSTIPLTIRMSSFSSSSDKL